MPNHPRRLLLTACPATNRSTNQTLGPPSNLKQGQATRLATGLRIFSPSLPSSSSSSRPGRALGKSSFAKASRLEHLELEASGFLKSRAWAGGRCPERTTLLVSEERCPLLSISLSVMEEPRRVKDARGEVSARCHSRTFHAAPESLPAFCSQPGLPGLPHLTCCAQRVRTVCGLLPS